MTQQQEAPKPSPAASPVAAKFIITANSPRELALKTAQALLREGLFEDRETQGGKDGKGEKKPYAVWNLDDSGTIANYNDGITLTPEEARMFPTGKGLPVVFSSSFALRQLAPAAVVAARISERLAMTATREANKVASASNSALLDEINKRRIAEGKAPITEI